MDCILVCEAMPSLNYQLRTTTRTAAGHRGMTAQEVGVYSCVDRRRVGSSPFILLANNLLFSITACLSGNEDILCFFSKCGPRLSDLMGPLVRHSGRGHLRPASLLCLRDVRRWRCRLDFASCGLPPNFLEHDRQLTSDDVGVLGATDVDEMEDGDKVVGEVVRLPVPGLFGLPVDVQDMTLIGEKSRVPASLLTEDQGAGESRNSWFGLITSKSLISGCSCNVSSILYKPTM